MNEGERCDRISLMHAGRVLATDTPAALIAARGAPPRSRRRSSRYLEEAARQAGAGAAVAEIAAPAEARLVERRGPRHFSPSSDCVAYARRESLELRRDPIRLTFALLGSALLMVVLGYGMTLDVEDLAFAALDRRREPREPRLHRRASPAPATSSRAPAHPRARRARPAPARAASSRSPSRSRPASAATSSAGARPRSARGWTGRCRSAGETIRGYVQGVHHDYLAGLALRGPAPRSAPWVDLEMRYRYNQDFRSLDAMVPGGHPAAAAVRPRDSDGARPSCGRRSWARSRTSTSRPVTRLEFLLGKQLPYVAVAMLSFFVLVALAVFVFGVPSRAACSPSPSARSCTWSTTTGFGL